MKKSNGKYVLIFFSLTLWVSFLSLIILSERNSQVIALPLFITQITNAELVEIDSRANDELNENFVPTSQSFDGDLVLAKEDNKTISQLTQIDADFIELENNIADSLDDNILNRESAQKNDGIEIPTDQSLLLLEKTNTIFPYYSSSDFLDIYNNFEQQQNLDFLTKYIYNIPVVDNYIKTKAQLRGYRQRGFAQSSDLISFENVQTRPEVKKSYVAMRNKMIENNMRLHFVSGYRSSSSQRSIFNGKLNIDDPDNIPMGVHDEKLDEALSRSAIPAYSKHHSGYAVDFGCGNDYLVFSFAETPCYEWLSADNFKNARTYGFIPSYPYNVVSQGPNPEPWEFVWVGNAAF